MPPSQSPLISEKAFLRHWITAQFDWEEASWSIYKTVNFNPLQYVKFSSRHWKITVKKMDSIISNLHEVHCLLSKSFFIKKCSAWWVFKRGITGCHLVMTFLKQSLLSSWWSGCLWLLFLPAYVLTLSTQDHVCSSGILRILGSLFTKKSFSPWAPELYSKAPAFEDLKSQTKLCYDFSFLETFPLTLYLTPPCKQRYFYLSLNAHHLIVPRKYRHPICLIGTCQ